MIHIYSGEQEFVNAIKTRLPEAAVYLFDNYAILLRKIVYCNIKDRDQVDAILACTMQTIWLKINDYPSEQRLTLWMAGIARQLAKEAASTTTVLYTLNKSEEPGEFPEIITA